MGPIHYCFNGRDGKFDNFISKEFSGRIPHGHNQRNLDALFPAFPTDSANHDHNSGQQVPEAKIFKDEELVNMIDPILQSDDKNRDINCSFHSPLIVESVFKLIFW